MQIGGVLDCQYFRNSGGWGFLHSSDPCVQKCYPVLGLGSGESPLRHLQTPVLHWIRQNPKGDGTKGKAKKSVINCRKCRKIFILWQIVVTFFSRPLPAVPFWFSPMDGFQSSEKFSGTSAFSFSRMAMQSFHVK